jgi:hypothetical protein
MSDWAHYGGPDANPDNGNRTIYEPGEKGDSKDQYVPCQILFFCFMPGTDQSITPSPHVLLRPCETVRTKGDELYDTVLFTRWRKRYNKHGAPDFVILPLSALYERVFVAEDDPAAFRQNISDSWGGRMSGVENNQEGGAINPLPRITARSDNKRQLRIRYPAINTTKVDQGQDYCYVCHPVRFWAGEFTTAHKY